MLTYIADPYRADTREEVNVNFQQARDTAIAAHQAGHTAICPLLNMTNFEGDCMNDSIENNLMDLAVYAIIGKQLREATGVNNYV